MHVRNVHFYISKTKKKSIVFTLFDLVFSRFLLGFRTPKSTSVSAATLLEDGFKVSTEGRKCQVYKTVSLLFADIRSTFFIKKNK